MINVVQGSPEWLKLRVGRVTASRVADIIAKTKSGPSASRANYMAELIAERLTGEPAERFTNASMAWGTEKEPEARAVYAFQYDTDVTEIGFVEHPTIAMCGASPDGLVGEKGQVEIKCPNTATHLETLMGGSIPSKYMTQMLWQMACTQREWCDFISYDPRLPATMQLFVKRVVRDDAKIAELEREVIEFIEEIDAKILALTTLYGISDQTRAT